MAPTNAQKPNNNILPLPPDFVPTTEERSLLDLYASIRSYEREAGRLKEKAAKAKLAAADERYQRELERKAAAEAGGTTDGGGTTANAKKGKSKRRRAKKKAKVGDGGSASDAEGAFGSDESSASGSEADEGSDDGGSSDEEGRLQGRAEAKLEKMRRSLDAARHTAEADALAAEEELRARHLGPDGDAFDDPTELGPSLQRKRPPGFGISEDKPAPSLIANLSGQATPPQDFSKKLGMGRANLDGKILFPSAQDGSMGGSWAPPPSASSPNEDAFEVELKDFDASKASIGQGNNTIAIKFTAPQDSKRFSLNIGPPKHQDYYNALFHFNPRQHQKGGQLVVNDKQEGIWGQGVNVPLSQLPLIFGQVSCTLIIQIGGDGFDVFIEGKHCARLEHRTQLPPKQCSLFLQFPSTDDYGSPENWIVYKVWWGHKSSMATGDLSGVAGVNIHSALHPKKLFISGLARIHTEPEVDLRRAELERAFRKYGGAQGAVVTVPTNSTFAFVEVDSERQADLALVELQSTYRMNRARRSKHEVLQEERAKAEAAKAGKVEESSEWD